MEPQAQDPRYPWKVLCIVVTGTLMAALDTSIVNVSLPAIMADFGASLDDIEWVITGYMLAFATLMPLTTWFKDRIGHRMLYIASLAVFTLGSVLCGMAWSLPTLVFARVIQAFGGGAITPTGMAMISEVFPPKDRARALGYWGMGVILGPAFGPTLGGWLTKDFGWRSIFMVNLPIGLVGALAAWFILKPDRPPEHERKGFDIWGFGFLSVFLTAFLLGLSKGEHEGWTSTYILTCFGLAALGFIGFLLVEGLVENGIIEIRLFASSIFSACMIVSFVRSIALFGGVFLLPLFLQQVQGRDEIDSGLILLPGSLVIGALMPVTGRLLDRFGPRVLTVIGLIGVAIFMYLYRDLDINTSVWGVIMPTLIRGFGIGLLFTPVMATALNHVPPKKAGMASSMLNLMQQVGGSVGIAMLATVLSHRLKFHLSVFGSLVDPQNPVVRASFEQATALAHSLGYNHAQSFQVARLIVSKTVITTASVAAFEDAFLFGSVIVLTGILVAILLPGQSVRTGGPEMTALE